MKLILFKFELVIVSVRKKTYSGSGLSVTGILDFISEPLLSCQWNIKMATVKLLNSKLNRTSVTSGCCCGGCVHVLYTVSGDDRLSKRHKGFLYWSTAWNYFKKWFYLLCLNTISQHATTEHCCSPMFPNVPITIVQGHINSNFIKT